MTELLTNVNWLAVVISTVVGFGLGALWYSPLLFVNAWLDGSHIDPQKTDGMATTMIVQFLGTFLMALLIALAVANDQCALACLAILSTATLICAGGGYNQKKAKARVIETAYIIALGALMMLVQSFF